MAERSDTTTDTAPQTGTSRVKRGMAEMLKGGVIMDVVTAEQAKIAEDAGAVAVMALERVPGRHPRPGRRVADERPRHDRRHHRGGLDPGDGQGPDRPLRRGAGAAEPRRRLRRRVRGADPGRLRQPHRQVGVHRAVRVRRDQPGRGAAPDHRGRGDDPLQGRGRHRRRVQRGHPHAHHPRPRSAGCGRWSPTSCTSRPRSCRRRTTWSRRSPRPASCPSCCSPPAASRPRPTRR